MSLADVRHVLLGRDEDATENEAAVPQSFRTGHDAVLRLADPLTSASHAELERRGRGWQLWDLQSSNGTQVYHPVSQEPCVWRAETRWKRGASDSERRPGLRFGEPIPLEHGDVLHIGRSFLLFCEQERVGAGELPYDPGWSDVAVTGLDGRAIPVCFKTFSPAVRRALDALALRRRMRRAFLRGEPGVGKESFAVAFQRLCGDEDFFPVNSAQFDTNLHDPEMFGVDPPGLADLLPRAGLLQEASRRRGYRGGTVFFDEIGDMKLPQQAKWLRVLQTSTVRPLGGTRVVPFDATLLFATNRDLDSMVNDGSFRADLRDRLEWAGVIEVPPLRERREDLGLLIAHQINLYGGPAEISEDLARALVLWDWRSNPTNLRGLSSVLAQLAAGAHVRFPAVQEENDLLCVVNRQPSSRIPSLLPPRPSLSPEIIEEAMRRHQGVTARAAEELGSSDAAFRSIFRRHGKDFASWRDQAFPARSRPRS